MPLCTLHLLSLGGSNNVEPFLKHLAADPSIKVIVASKPRFLVARPKATDVLQLTEHAYNLVLLLQTADGAIPESLRGHIDHEYKVFCGIPSKLLAGYPEKNRRLRQEARTAGLTGSLDRSRLAESSQNLEFSSGLQDSMEALLKEHQGPVTMLNLLKFNKDGKSTYYKYGQAFVEVASKRGGDAKIVGNIVQPSSSASDLDATSPNSWEEVAIVHYASIKHFCDMAAGEDYQDINRRYRLPALADTLLLCTTEIDVDTIRRKEKL